MPIPPASSNHQGLCPQATATVPAGSPVRRLARLGLAAGWLLCSLSAAGAASSDWHVTEGARLRLLTTGTAQKDGILRGALQIDLKPGWKTYWRDPGGSGVPPTIDVSGNPHVASAEMDFPAPVRVDDASGSWVGYKHSVVFPVSFTLAPGSEAQPIKADIFIGVCQEICVPVQASLALDPQADAENAEDTAVIEAAVVELPSPDRAGFKAELKAAEGDRMVVSATAPEDGGDLDLFVEASDGYVLGTPEKRRGGAGVEFVVPILDRPARRPDGLGFHYTLASEQGAVQGRLPYP